MSARRSATRTGRVMFWRTRCWLVARDRASRIALTGERRRCRPDHHRGTGGSVQMTGHPGPNRHPSCSRRPAAQPAALTPHGVGRRARPNNRGRAFPCPPSQQQPRVAVASVVHECGTCTELLGPVPSDESALLVEGS
jgi:hypothetical protein